MCHRPSLNEYGKIYYYNCLIKVGNARLGEFDLHSICPKTPAPHYQPIERKKMKGVEDKMGASSLGNKKSLAILLKPARPAPSNAGSAGSFHRDTERVIIVLRTCMVVQTIIVLVMLAFNFIPQRSHYPNLAEDRV